MIVRLLRHPRVGATKSASAKSLSGGLGTRLFTVIDPKSSASLVQQFLVMASLSLREGGEVYDRSGGKYGVIFPCSVGDNRGRVVRKDDNKITYTCALY